jgi:hypothetical protein
VAPCAAANRSGATARTRRSRRRRSERRAREKSSAQQNARREMSRARSNTQKHKYMTFIQPTAFAAWHPTRRHARLLGKEAASIPPTKHSNTYWKRLSALVTYVASSTRTPCKDTRAVWRRPGFLRGPVLVRALAVRHFSSLWRFRRFLCLTSGPTSGPGLCPSVLFALKAPFSFRFLAN